MPLRTARSSFPPRDPGRLPFRNQVPLGVAASFAGWAAMAAVVVVLTVIATIDHRLAS
ncbi:hypothetical protein ACBJ59_30440 [Nonomuraea sp. MTCD27]|uniref:hypothetical protein n=1 Tax=Nonomuraea sp. MTCD27 TaxID=1676747 RepID=UPI0035C08DF0